MVDLPAPDPETTSSTSVTGVPSNASVIRNPSLVSVTLAACGGGGMNFGRPFAQGKSKANVLYFDTSMANSRAGEDVNIVTNGNGSGSHRSENARDIEREIATMDDDKLGVADVAIIAFSLAGGSGSVIGPILARELFRRKGMRVICVAISDNSSTISAKNTINTLKTLSAIANNAGMYLPMVIVSNDQPKGRRGADLAAQQIIGDLIELLTTPVYEVDRNDRLNWIDPSKVIGTKAGLKLLHMDSDKTVNDPTIVIGADSIEMVDSLLVTQTEDSAELQGMELPMSRLKKVGFYEQAHRPLVGKVTGDIKAIDDIIDSVERVQQSDKSQRYEAVDRLKSDSDDDLILG